LLKDEVPGYTLTIKQGDKVKVIPITKSFTITF
jgi:hypothetical protein